MITIKRILGGVLLQQIVSTSVAKRYLFHGRLGKMGVSVLEVVRA